MPLSKKDRRNRAVAEQKRIEALKTTIAEVVFVVSRAEATIVILWILWLGYYRGKSEPVL